MCPLADFTHFAKADVSPVTVDENDVEDADEVWLVEVEAVELWEEVEVELEVRLSS